MHYPSWLTPGAIVEVDGDARKYVVVKVRVSDRFGGGVGADLQRVVPPLLKFPKTVGSGLLRRSTLSESPANPSGMPKGSISPESPDGSP